MKAHELARQLLASRDLEVTFSTFEGNLSGHIIWLRRDFPNAVHEVTEHDEPEDFIEIILEAPRV